MTVAIAALPTDRPFVSMRQLEYLIGRERKDMQRIASHVGRYYKPFDVFQQGRKWRHIDNPTKELKYLQGRIYKTLLARVPIPPTMLGGTIGGSVKKNAEHHCGNPLLVTLDLVDCFGRIDDLTVFRVFRECVGCSERIADLLTKLTTLRHRLPQGAPSSSALANLALLPLHDSIAAIAARYGLVCTFFVDDIALSGPCAYDAIEPVVRVIQRSGHAVRTRKKHITPRNSPQIICGTIVNSERPSIQLERRELVRERILQLGHRAEILDWEIRSLTGHINHIRIFCPGYAKRLDKLLERLLPLDTVARQKPDEDQRRRPCNGSNCYARPVRALQGVPRGKPDFPRPSIL